MILIGGGIAAVLLSSYLAFALSASITTPLQQASQSARRIAQGDPESGLAGGGQRRDR